MNQVTKKDYEFECYEKYVGGIDEVKRAMENCPACGEKLMLGHSADHGNLLMHETARCIKCDFGQRKLVYTLN